MNLLKLHRIRQEHNTSRLVRQMKQDVEYIIESRPRFLPFSIWFFILYKLLKLDKNNLTRICLNKSTKKR